MLKFAAAFLAGLGVVEAVAQAVSSGNEFATSVAGKSVVGTMNMYWDAVAGYARPASSSYPLPVTSSGIDSGPVSATGTVNSSSHAAGTSVGGLITVPLARIAGGSGIITGVQWLSPNGSTGQLVLRGWTKSPSSTCTDNTAFANNSADDPYLIVGTPVAITPAAPASTTGDARTYAQLTGLTWNYKNADGTPSQNLYFCAVTVATDTADESSSPRLTLAGPQN